MQTHAHKHTLPFTHTHTLSLLFTHAFTHTHTLIHSLTHIHPLSITHTHTLSLIHSLSHTPSHSHTHSHKHTQTYAHGIHSLSLSLFLSQSILHLSLLPKGWGLYRILPEDHKTRPTANIWTYLFDGALLFLVGV